MNIILIGYRGSGKTTIGRKLASQLWKTFVDTDDEVCKRFDNSTIAQIWDEHGERAFRDMEIQVTRELCDRDDLVIGLGGGTVLEAAARAAVEAAQAIRIYLKCEPKELHQRISGDQQTAAQRPNLTALGGGVAEIEAVLDEREPVYEAVADHVFDVTHVTADEAVGHLVRMYL